jgi:sec-independent protein translocase protein TatA
MGLDNPLHVVILVVVLLLVFGARRLPEIGRSLGSGMREFKDSISGGEGKPTLNAGEQQPQPPAAQPVATPAPQQAPPQPPAPAEQPNPFGS